ncbi:MAG: homoserine kinase [Leptospiraceae bacterium]|nr:homoserine kinase [Leptospiraceae bacterium]MCP5497550.1 homoserine kinase [Leptospiraceae bacterium]
MVKSYKLYIKVPGTSANLGPGFDVLGLALKIYNEFTFEFSKKSSYKIQLHNGGIPPFEPEDDLVRFSYLKYFKHFLDSVEPLPYDVTMKLGLPIKGGLGSSASAVVAGFTAAFHIHKQFFKKKKLPTESQFLYELALLEGHPDNTTPAYLGGFILSFFENGERLQYFKRIFPKNVSLFILIPDAQVATISSRKKLPEKYEVQDVVYNMSRVGTWIEFFNSKKFKHLQSALNDRVHTPYRLKEFPFLNSIIEKISQLDGGYSLSGSGPSILIYSKKSNGKNFAKHLEVAISESMKQSKIPYYFGEVLPEPNGIDVKILT